MNTQAESFLPEDYLEKRVERRTNIISLTLFIVVMGGVIAAFFVTDVSEVFKLQKQVDQQFVDAARRIDQLDELQRRKDEMIRKARTTALLLERVPRSILLAELINNMPPSLSLLEFELSSKVVTARQEPVHTLMEQAQRDAKRKAKDKDKESEVKDTEVMIQLIGVAPTDVQVAQFMTALGRAELFSDVSLAYSEEIMIDKESMRKFRVEIKLNPGVDTRRYEPKMVKRELNQNPMSDKVRIAPLGPDGAALPAND